MIEASRHAKIQGASFVMRIFTSCMPTTTSFENLATCHTSRQPLGAGGIPPSSNLPKRWLSFARETEEAKVMPTLDRPVVQARPVTFAPMDRRARGAGKSMQFCSSDCITRASLAKFA
eukprot:934483-Amphidinium_carterae.1